MFTGCKGKRVSQKTNDPAETGKKGNISLEAGELQFAAKYIDGCTARMKGNVSEALKLFNECYKLNPKNIPLKYELAMVNKLLGVNDIALIYAKECAEAEPKNEWYQLLLIDCYHTLKQYQNSIKVQENLVKNFPTNTEFKENLAIEYTFIGAYDKAYNVYNELEKQFGINEQLTINKVKLLQQEKRYNDIEKEVNKLIASSPENPRYLTYLAEHFEFMKQPEKAKEVYDKIIEIDPHNPTVHLALSDYYKLKGDETTSYNELKLAFWNPELDVYTKANIAQVYFNTFKRYPESNYGEQGKELAGIMIKVHPSAPESNAIQGDFLFYEKNYADALKYYYIASLKDKGNYRTWEKLLNCENMTQKYDSLERHSFEAMELFPSQPYVYYFNGLANFSLHNYSKSIQSFKDGLEFVIDDKPLMSAFYSYLGDAYHYQKEYEKSDKAFDDALKLNADNTYVLNNYAYYLSVRKEQLEKAEKLSRKCIELKPNEANYLDTYGWILFQLGKYQQAQEYLEKACELNSRNPNVLEHMGDCLLMLNKPTEAVSYWEKAMNFGGNKERLGKKIKEKKLDVQ